MVAHHPMKCVVILLMAIIMLLVPLAPAVFAEKSDQAATKSNEKEKSYSPEEDIAEYPFKPPNTSSPQATLTSFIENMNRGYRILMAAHRQNLQTPGLFTSDGVQKIARRADELIMRSIFCLNLSRVEEEFREKAGYEAALMLKEILDRIELPPAEQIPGAKAIELEEDKEKTIELDRWRIPDTGIVIARVEDGPRKEEYLFTPETIGRLERFYTRAKEIPYKSNVFVSRDFYDFYASTPGQLLPPKWNKWIPAWSTQVYLGQAIWQWCALILLPMFVLAVIWVLVRVWYRWSAEYSAVTRFSGWIFIFLFNVTAVMIIKYILHDHVNISGSIMVVVENMLQVVFLLLLVGLIAWEALKTRIKNKVPQEVNEEDDEDEWGAASLSRADTMLLLLRKFFVIILFTIVGFLLLSAMGINIGPLLAGAGVIGIAIGFGSQKLIADVLSGIFYLIDDAFRVGEYIKAGSVSGTVEAITLRNVKLRHHRGMLQFVPYSELGSITNFMRGGMVVKFNIELPYDTDIEKVRKIIKKVGKKMLKDPELGPDFIKPVKSQGVRSVGDSVMTFRVKFTAQPGKHFVIRREAFRRITEALEAKGIYYAHRKVIVELPADEQSASSPEQEKQAASRATPGQEKLLAGAAAGLETIVNEEIENRQPPKKK